MVAALQQQAGAAQSGRVEGPERRGEGPARLAQPPIGASSVCGAAIMGASVPAHRASAAAGRCRAADRCLMTSPPCTAPATACAASGGVLHRCILQGQRNTAAPPADKQAASSRAVRGPHTAAGTGWGAVAKTILKQNQGIGIGVHAVPIFSQLGEQVQRKGRHGAAAAASHEGGL